VSVDPTLPVLAAVVLASFRMLGGSRLVPLIRSAALQGALLALVSVLIPAHAPTRGAVALALGNALVKGLVLPALLLRAIRQVEIRRELEPLVGYTPSLLLGALALLGAALAAARLPLDTTPGGQLLAPVGALTLFTGFFLMASRRKAIGQALGYLVFENGIYALGIALAHDEPLLVELGVLLDLFVAVFVMGIIVFHIQEEFAHIDVDRIAALHDVERTEGDPR
jgi:hydrogenase-4 component E